MKTLDKNWITQGRIDFEYKKYLLLAYLQQASSSFNTTKIYPFLSDLIGHYSHLKELKKQKDAVADAFPRKLKHIDPESFKLEYENMLEKEEFMEEIHQILEFAIPKLKSGVEEGKEIYDFVERQLEINPIGIVPLNMDFGYLFIKEHRKKEMRVFEYSITIFENANEKFRGLKTSFKDVYSKSISNTYESIKLDLIQRYQDTPNPATFLINSKLSFPYNETLFPIAKRTFIRYISNLA